MHTIEGAKRSAYRAAAELAKELRGYAERVDQTVEFAAWVRKVRTDNTRRRALQNEVRPSALCHVSQPPWWLVTAAWPNQPRLEVRC